MEVIKLISLVVPAYNQEKRIKKNIRNLLRVLETIGIPYELIVVVDGKTDKTFERARQVKSPNLKVLVYKENRGKGFAVKYGMLKGKGDIIGFIDAGMDIDAAGIAILLDSMLWRKAEIMVGSKLHPDSKVKYPKSRKILSWGFRALCRILFGFKVRDTQVGLKLFRKNVVKRVFPKLLVKTFAFDVEVLAIANALGYDKIYEGPIKLRFNKSSSITSTSFWNIISLMLWDTIAIFYRLRILNYYRKKQSRR